MKHRTILLPTIKFCIDSKILDFQFPFYEVRTCVLLFILFSDNLLFKPENLPVIQGAAVVESHVLL